MLGKKGIFCVKITPLKPNIIWFALKMTKKSRDQGQAAGINYGICNQKNYKSWN